MHTLQALKQGQPVDIPQYDFATNARKKEVTAVRRADVILFDGILAFYDPGKGNNKLYVRVLLSAALTCGVMLGSNQDVTGHAHSLAISERLCPCFQHMMSMFCSAPPAV